MPGAVPVGRLFFLLYLFLSSQPPSTTLPPLTPSSATVGTRTYTDIYGLDWTASHTIICTYLHIVQLHNFVSDTGESSSILSPPEPWLVLETKSSGSSRALTSSAASSVVQPKPQPYYSLCLSFVPAVSIFSLFSALCPIFLIFVLLVPRLVSPCRLWRQNYLFSCRAWTGSYQSRPTQAQAQARESTQRGSQAHTLFDVKSTWATRGMCF